MNNLKINLDTLQSTYDYVSGKYSEFQTMFNNFDAAIDDLKNGEWDSDAKDKFTDLYDDSWKGDMLVFLGILEQMTNELKYANEQYSELNELKPFPKSYYR